jgi:ABC-2 type transport system permease protein
MRDLITSQQARAALHIGPTFARDLAGNQSAPVQFIVDARSSNTAAIALGYAARIVAQYNQSLIAQRPTTRPSSLPRQAVLVDRAWFNPNYLSRWFFVPAIVVQLVLIEVLLVCSLSVAREREQGTFDQLLVSPYATWELLAGKAAPGLLIGLPQAAIAVVIAVYWFGVPLRGSLTALFVGLLSYIACAAGVGLLLSSLARTMQQALLGTFLFMMPASLLSGLATPIEDMPRWIQYLTLINPPRYALHIARDIFLRGATMHDIVGDLVPMTIIGVACLAAAGILFRLRSQ